MEPNYKIEGNVNPCVSKYLGMSIGRSRYLLGPLLVVLSAYNKSSYVMRRIIIIGTGRLFWEPIGITSVFRTIFWPYFHELQKKPAHSITITYSTFKKSTWFLGPLNYLIQRKIRCLASVLNSFDTICLYVSVLPLSLQNGQIYRLEVKWKDS